MMIIFLTNEFLTNKLTNQLGSDSPHSTEQDGWFCSDLSVRRNTSFMCVCLSRLQWVLSIVCKWCSVSEVWTGSALPFLDSRQCELIRMQWKLDASCLHCFDSVLWAA